MRWMREIARALSGLRRLLGPDRGLAEAAYRNRQAADRLDAAVREVLRK